MQKIHINGDTQTADKVKTKNKTKQKQKHNSIHLVWQRSWQVCPVHRNGKGQPSVCSSWIPGWWSAAYADHWHWCTAQQPVHNHSLHHCFAQWHSACVPALHVKISRLVHTRFMKFKDFSTPFPDQFYYSMHNTSSMDDHYCNMWHHALICKIFCEVNPATHFTFWRANSAAGWLQNYITSPTFIAPKSLNFEGLECLSSNSATFQFSMTKATPGYFLL